MADRYVSLKPSDAVTGGAMVPEGEYDIAAAQFAMWDYNGNVIPPVPALGIEYKDGPQTYHQYYSAGDAKNFEATEDGKRLRAKGSTTGLNVSTNCYALMKSLVDSGFDEDKLVDDISVIAGARVKVAHEQAPEREIGGRKIEKRMIPVISKVISMPVEGKPASTSKKGAKASPSASPSKANGSEEAVSGDLLVKATKVLIGLLKAAPDNTLDKKGITRGIYNTMPVSDVDRSPILNIAVLEPFLSGLADYGVVWDAGKGTAMYVGD